MGRAPVATPALFVLALAAAIAPLSCRSDHHVVARPVQWMDAGAEGPWPGHPEAAEELQRVLVDASPELRTAASEALSVPSPGVDLSRFRRVLEDSDASSQDRNAAIAMLATHGARSDLDDLLRIVERTIASPPPRVYAHERTATRILASLLRRGDPKALAFTLDLATRKTLDRQANEDIRGDAIRLLGSERVVAARSSLLQVLNDGSDDPLARKRAAIALCEIDPDHEGEYGDRYDEIDRQRIGGR